MPLHKLELQDFQAHAHKVLKLAPGITTVVGPTDAGKSAIIRALRWACLNDLPGDEFIREGAKSVEVSVKLDCDHTVTRRKGRHNTYELDGKEYEAVGRDVPRDIARLLQVSALNFQGQHDSPFWFSESAAEVSRQLNAVVDLSVIDTCLSNVAALVRQAQERKSVLAERLEEVRTKWNALKGQADRIDDYGVLQELYEKQESAKSRVDSLAGGIKQIRTSRDSLRKTEQELVEQEALLALAKEDFATTRQWSELQELVHEITKLSAASQPPPSFAGVELAHDEFLAADQQHNELVDVIQAIRRAIAVVASRNITASFAETQFTEQTKGKRCPTCQRPL